MPDDLIYVGVALVVRVSAYLFRIVEHEECQGGVTRSGVITPLLLCTSVGNTATYCVNQQTGHINPKPFDKACDADGRWCTEQGRVA
jgi:hypothetical protein